MRNDRGLGSRKPVSTVDAPEWMRPAAAIAVLVVAFILVIASLATSRLMILSALLASACLLSAVALLAGEAPLRIPARWQAALDGRRRPASASRRVALRNLRGRAVPRSRVSDRSGTGPDSRR